MPGSAAALLACAVFIYCWQWCWVRVAAHVAPSRIPAHSRRRVQWLIANSTYIQLAAGALAASAVAVAVLDQL